MSKKYNVIINNKLIEVNSNYNVLQVCNIMNIDIPKFCYHEKLSIAGNCRMCLVEVKGMAKPIASCSLPINHNMVIFTNTNIVKKAREGILEFLLLNHPLDCPICDQGGECDLQDQALIYGGDKGRFYEFKRAVNDKNCGSLIKTVMTRCIHCTRCIRFIDEYIGNKYLGLIGRGHLIEISNFISKAIISEISGNLIDLCPVGALTSKPYSFVARPWELRSINTIDLNDIMHMNIRVDIRDYKVIRILPIFNSLIKEDWITDITRFSYDGYNNQRLITPFEKIGINFISKSWLKLLYKINKKIKDKTINFYLGNLVDCESALLIKKLSNTYGRYTINSIDKKINNNKRSNYIANYNILNNLDNFDNVILINFNMRVINPLLYFRLKNLKRKNIIKIFNIGINYNYINNLDNTILEFKKLIEGKSYMSNIMTKKNNLIIFNDDQVILNTYLENIKVYLLKYTTMLESLSFRLNSTGIIVNEFNLINSIHRINDISYKSMLKNNNYNINYFLNTNNFIYNMNNTYSIYQGQYLTDMKLLSVFNILLPSVNQLEKIANFINFFGYIQNINLIMFPPKQARSDWKIIFLIFKLFINLEKLDINSKLLLKELNYYFTSFNFFVKKNYILNISYNTTINNKYKYNILNKFFYEKITNIFKENLVSRSSLIINKYLKVYKNININFI